METQAVVAKRLPVWVLGRGAVAGLVELAQTAHKVGATAHLAPVERRLYQVVR
jgi:hypothetical protein